MSDERPRVPGASGDPRVVAVVPCYNEADVVGATVGALAGLPEVDSVVAVDDASSDDSGQVASAAGARVVLQGTNLGKGGSLGSVLPHLDFDVVVLIDGDLGEHASDASLLLEPVLAGEADLAIAVFPPATRKGGFGMVKGLARWGIRTLCGLEVREPVSGQRAMTRETFEKVTPLRAGFGVEVAMTIDAARAGMRIVEVETGMSHRQTGRDLAGFVHRGRQFADIARAIASRAFVRGRT